MRLARPHPCLLFLFSLFLFGCGEESLQDTGLPFTPLLDDAYEQDADERDAVYRTATGVQEKAFRAAFSDLTRYNFTRHITVEQFDAQQTLLATTTRTIRSVAEGDRHTHTTLQADTAQTFDFGALASFSSPVLEEPEATALARYLLPEDPPYLSERNREAFSYRTLPDTLLGDRPTQVLEIRTLPGDEGRYALRYIRLYLDRATQEVVGLYLERWEQSFLFDEASIIEAILQPASDQQWVPQRVRVVMRIRMPLRAPQQFRTETTYYDYSPTP